MMRKKNQMRTNGVWMMKKNVWKKNGNDNFQKKNPIRQLRDANVEFLCKTIIPSNLDFYN